MRRGRAWKGKHLTVRCLTGAPRHPSVNPARNAVYVGTLISAKTEKSAVKRNRMRRRCREALRIILPQYLVSSSVQLLLMPRSTSLSCDFNEIQRDIESLLSSLFQHVPKR